MLRIDKSKLILFMKNPKLFKLIYVDKVEQPMSVYAERGKFFHALLVDEFSKLKALYYSNRENFRKVATTYIQNQIVQHQKRRISNIYKFLYSWLSNSKTPEQFFPAFLEKKFEFYDKNLNATLVGRIDVAWLINSKYTVGDFKVSSYRRKAYAILPNGVNESSFEINFYMYLLDCCGYPTNNIGYIIPIDGKSKLVAVSKSENFSIILRNVVSALRKKLEEWGVDEI